MRKTFEITRKRYYALLLTASLLASLAAGIYLGISGISGNQKAADAAATAGVSPYPCRYIIDTNGTWYFAYNGTSGALEYTSQSASSLVNTVIKSMGADVDRKRAGVIHFRNGKYWCNTPIIINSSDIVLEGEGRATSLMASGSSDCIVYVRNAVNNSTESIMIRDLSFYNSNPGAANRTVAIRFWNNDPPNYRIMFPTVQSCWFDFIDGIASNTSGSWGSYIGLQGIRILDCVFSWTPNYAVKLWNVIDGNIQNLFADFGVLSSNTVGIELIYPVPLSSGIYLDDVSIAHANVGINYTGGSEGWFTNIVTDLCGSCGFLLKNCNRTMVTNAYSSTSSLIVGTGFRLDGSYKNRFESCVAYYCNRGFWSASNIGKSWYNIFTDSISEGNAIDWYFINQYDKFSGCNYIIQDAGYATIPIGSTSVTVTHDIAGTPNVVTTTAYSNPPVSVSVTSVSGSTFTIVRSGSTSAALQVYWYAAMSDHLP